MSDDNDHKSLNVELLNERLTELEAKVYQEGKERKLVFKNLKKAVTFSFLIGVSFACVLGSKELKEHGLMRIGDFLDSASVLFLTTALVTIFPKLGNQLNKLLLKNVKELLSSDDDKEKSENKDAN